MPPKKKEGGSKSTEVVEGEDPTILLANYVKYCKMIGLSPNPSIARQLNDEEHYPFTQFVVDDEFGPLGAGGTRALMTSIMGTGPGMKGGPYKLLKSLRFWRAGVGDEGANAIAEVLRLGGAEVKISYLELLDNQIGPPGASALGVSLSQGHNLSLLTLKLDFNPTLTSEGLDRLVRGLRTNSSLKQLHLQFCGIDSEGGASLGALLANRRSVLEVLNLSGNRLGGRGLRDMCGGLVQNQALQSLSLADNMIERDPEDLEGLGALADCLLTPSLGLVSVDLMYNRIGEEGGLVLARALTEENTKIKDFLVDLTLPLDLFNQIFRKSGGKKGKKGGGKKPKKK